jgi:hypothetical protein
VNDKNSNIDISVEAWGAVVSNQLAALDSAFLTSEDEEEKLHGYAAALAYLITACKRFPGFEGGTEILDSLLLKLTDIMAGTPALQPVKHTGRAKHGWREAIIQGRACAAVDLLVEHGEREDDACKIIAEALAGAGVKGRKGGQLSLSTLRDWRSRAAKFGDKEDAREIREGVHILRRLVDLGSLTKVERRRRITLFVTGGAVLR